MPVTNRFVRYAPKAVRYLVTAIADNVPRARRLVVSTPLSSADGGDNGDFTLSVAGATSLARGVLKLAGQLGGTADLPDVRGIRVLDGGNPSLLTLGEVQDGEVLARSGSGVVGVSAVPTAGGTMSGNLQMGGNKVTNLGNASAAGDAVPFGQVASMLNGLDWQASVVDAVAGPPGSPGNGARYLVIATASGAWAGHEEKIAEWNGSVWGFIVPNKGFTVHVEANGQDLTYNGSHPAGAWVNIGASVDHSSLLNLSTGDPHPQYQRESERDQAGGYAGLDGVGMLAAPARRLRAGADPDPVNPGEAWVTGKDLKFRDNDGTPATQFAERQSNKGQANGYAALDGSGKVAQPPANHAASHAPGGTDALPVDQATGTGSLRTLGTGAQQACAGNDGRLSDARNPTAHAGSHAAGQPDAITPATIGAPPAARQVNTGTGLAGGGDLTGDRTLSIGAFTGILSKDDDLGSQEYAGSTTVTIATYNVLADGMILPLGLRLPAVGDNVLRTRAVFEFENNSNPIVVVHDQTSGPLDLNVQSLADVLAGPLSAGGANNGRRIQKILFQVQNTSGSPVTVDLGAFRIRAMTFPRGAGAAL